MADVIHVLSVNNTQKKMPCIDTNFYNNQKKKETKRKKVTKVTSAFMLHCVIFLYNSLL